MREIKFRVWHKEDKEMIYPKGVGDTFHCGGCYLEELFDSEDYPVMQFTGLKDKNGKDIYGGDIVGRKNPDWVGGFQDKQVVEIKEFQDEDGDYFGYKNFEDGRFEVIGNIYENPDLLSRS